MFRPNDDHLQPHLFSDLGKLSSKQRQRLETSWAAVYRREVYSRLDEEPFAVLYSDKASRPNVPVNRMLSFDAIKYGFGWSDAETYDHLSYDMQVRYAVGLDNLGEGEFDLRTVYNFRRRLDAYKRRTGRDLVHEAFAQITDAQAEAFDIQTDRLRIDSTQVSSNIRRMVRLELLVEVLQRVYRMLTEADQAYYAEAFAPYLKGSASQYIYHLRGQDTAPHMARIGRLMYRLLAELSTLYGDHDVYQMLQRVFHEQYNVMERTVEAKPGKAISPSSLRSPDDPDATFRRKGNQEYEGYVTAVTETSGDDNPFQLIVNVQVAPNNTEDATLLGEALPELKARTGVEVIYNDGGFCSPDTDQVLREHQVVQVPTELRGRPPNPNKLNLVDFHIDAPLDGQLLESRRDSQEPGVSQEALGERTRAPECAALEEPSPEDGSSATEVGRKAQSPENVDTCAGAVSQPSADSARSQGDAVSGSGSVGDSGAQAEGLAGHPSSDACCSHTQAVAKETSPDQEIEQGSGTVGSPLPKMTCPHGQTVSIERGRNPGRYCAYFDPAICEACPLQSKCPTRAGKLDPRRRLGFNQREVDIAQRRRRAAAYCEAGKNPRAAVEATIGAVKRPFSDDQLPVRGLLRMQATMIGPAIMVNVRRIQRYLAKIAAAGRPEHDPAGSSCASNAKASPFLSLLQTWLSRRLWPASLPQPALALSC
ncbi:MAG: transposase [Anaerolineae bacterium]